MGFALQCRNVSFPAYFCDTLPACEITHLEIPGRIDSDTKDLSPAVTAHFFHGQLVRSLN